MVLQHNLCMDPKQSLASFPCQRSFLCTHKIMAEGLVHVRDVKGTQKVDKLHVGTTKSVPT